MTFTQPGLRTILAQFALGVIFLHWVASSASAIPNTGFGYDGSLVVTGTTYVDSVKSPVSANVTSGASFIPLASTAGFLPGHEVLVFTAQGSSPSVGSYNFYTIQNVSPSGVSILGQLPAALDITNDRNFVQQVPNYSEVTVQSGGVLTASPWNGATGGVVAFRVRGELDVNTGGAILADGLGFRGGSSASVPSNGAAVPGFQGESYNGLGAQGVNVAGVAARNFGAGGAGLADSTGGDVGGGGGGGSYGDSPLGVSAASVFGTTTTLEGGQAGEAYGVSDLSKIFFGSGGGSGGADSDSGLSTSGTGGTGGGVIFIAANTMTLDGTLQSKGINGGNGIGAIGTDETGGGGGGSGGSIYLALLNPTPFQSLDPLLITPGGLGGADTTGSFALEGGAGGVGRYYATLAEVLYAPEPSSAVLWGVGLVVLMVRRRSNVRR